MHVFRFYGSVSHGCLLGKPICTSYDAWRVYSSFLVPKIQGNHEVCNIISRRVLLRTRTKLGQTYNITIVVSVTLLCLNTNLPSTSLKKEVHAEGDKP